MYWKAWCTCRAFVLLIKPPFLTLARCRGCLSRYGFQSKIRTFFFAKTFRISFSPVSSFKKLCFACQQALHLRREANCERKLERAARATSRDFLKLRTCLLTMYILMITFFCVWRTAGTKMGREREALGLCPPRHPLPRTLLVGPGGGGTAIYGLYRYVPLWRVWFSSSLL